MPFVSSSSSFLSLLFILRSSSPPLLLCLILSLLLNFLVFPCVQSHATLGASSPEYLLLHSEETVYFSEMRGCSSCAGFRLMLTLTSSSRLSSEKILPPAMVAAAAADLATLGFLCVAAAAEAAPHRPACELNDYFSRPTRSGRFDYVNVHAHFMGNYTAVDNWPAVAAARERSMGVFIISPSHQVLHHATSCERCNTLCQITLGSAR